MVVLRLDYQHDCDSCESCIDFWTGLSKSKDADSDADSGYCSGTTRTIEDKIEEQPLVIPSIIVTPLTTAEERAHTACLREMAALRNTLTTNASTSSLPAYSSPWNSSSSSARSSFYSSSRVDLAFANQSHLRPPEESYTRKLKDTWENRIAYPHQFPPLHLYSSRLNASLPSLLPSSSSGSGSKVLKGEMVPLSPSILRKRTSRDQIDSVHSVTLRRNNVLVKPQPQRPLATPIQPSPLSSSSSKSASYPPPSSTKTMTSSTTPSTPMSAPTIGTRRPGRNEPVVRKRWSIAGSGVGINLQDAESTLKENNPPSVSITPTTTGSKFVETSFTTSPTPSNKPNTLAKPPPPRNLTQLRALQGLKKSNESQDSLSSLGSVLSTTSTVASASGGNGGALGRSDKSNLSGFKKGWGKLMGRYSTAPSSFKML